MVDLEGCVSYADDELEEQNTYSYLLVRVSSWLLLLLTSIG
jgi:hypothetical protein